jgi:hypothetical protein
MRTAIMRRRILKTTRTGGHARDQRAKTQDPYECESMQHCLSITDADGRRASKNQIVAR